MSSGREFQSVEEYFERLRGLLIGMPQAEIDEAVEEMAPHLQALVAAERDAGASEDEAVKNAIAKFGEPKAIARKIGIGFLEEKMRIVDSQRSKPARLRWAVFLGTIGLFGLLQGTNGAFGLPGLSYLTVSFGLLGLIAGISSVLFLSADSEEEFAALLETAPELKQMMAARLGNSAITKAGHPWARGPWYKRWALRLAQPQLDAWKESMIAALDPPSKRRKPRINPLFAACWLVWLGVLALMPAAARSFVLPDTAFFLAMSVGDWLAQWVRYARSLKRTYGS